VGAALIATGLDRLLADPTPLAGRRYGLLAHQAAVTADLAPGHLALAAAGAPPRRLFGPEHGFYGVEQDMVPAASGRDPLTGLPIRSLYGDSAASLVPAAAAFDGLDLLVVDLQDVGARYYTFAATAVWAARVAAGCGCEVLVLDRPNPLGGELVEGNLPEPGLESFVGAFPHPVCHGLTLGELVLLEARRQGFDEAVRVLPMSGWRRALRWPRTGRPWIAPSPNMPAYETARVYPGGCLVEATTLSEGRGTARPFLWLGAPGVDPAALAVELHRRELPGVRFLPHFFKPHYQKHAGQVCGGVEVVVTDEGIFRPYRTGLELLFALRRAAPEAFSWRSTPYEFVGDRPAIDLLTGTRRVREALAGPDPDGGLAAFVAAWGDDEERFRQERRGVLLYPEEGP
jgi:uncharacterized protein YbbC (DUF1343 family)